MFGLKQLPLSVAAAAGVGACLCLKDRKVALATAAGVGACFCLCHLLSRSNTGHGNQTPDLKEGDPRAEKFKTSIRAPKWDGRSIPETLLFEGGGTKGSAYVGTIKALEEAGLCKKLKNFAGTSAGSQIAALVAFGYDSADLEWSMRNTPWDKIMDNSSGWFGWIRDIKRILYNFGYFKGDYLEEFLDGRFERKCGKKRCTFQELYEKTGNELRLGACCVTTGQFEFLDRHSYPNMPVAVGCRASSAIPVIFQPVIWAGPRGRKLFVDGGLMGNLPMHAFPGTKAVALEIVSRDEYTERYSKGQPKEPESLMQFLGMVLATLLSAAQETHGRAASLADNDVDVIEVVCASNGMLDTGDAALTALVETGLAAGKQYVDGKTAAT